MKRIVAADIFDNEFWTLHEDGGYEEGVKLEEIISDLGWDNDFFPEEGLPTATDEQYEEVLRIYREQGGNTTVYTEDKVLSEVIAAVSDCMDDVRVESFEEAGLMTNNKGFVVYAGGESYQFELLGSF